MRILNCLLAALLAVLAVGSLFADAFAPAPITNARAGRRRPATTTCRPSAQPSTRLLAQISEKEASSAIDKVVAALRKDKEAQQELGKLTTKNNVLGFGSPRPGIIAVRFNASFKKGGMGNSAVPLPFGLGQSNKSEGRGTMVGQVKAEVDEKTGKIRSCSVFRDLGYGRAFNLKV
ncbi:hypothetical protein ACHAXT_003146 [Thalassiosira profunda]